MNRKRFLSVVLLMSFLAVLVRLALVLPAQAACAGPCVYFGIPLPLCCCSDALCATAVCPLGFNICSCNTPLSCPDGSTTCGSCPSTGDPGTGDPGTGDPGDPPPPPPPPCSPSCGSPACGGGDGCGGTCSSADAGAPGLPTISSPTNGGIALMNASTLRITIDWNNTSKADYYQIQVYPVGSDCTDPDAYCQNTTGSAFSFVPNQVDYQVRVRAVNNSCGSEVSSWTAFSTFSVHAPVTGTLYLDESNTAALGGGVCQTGAVLATTQAGASSVSIEQNGQDYTAGSVQANGTYQATAPYWDPGNNFLQLNIGDSGLYTCTCPAGCVYSGISTPQSGVNFYLIEARDPWFQVSGGPISAYNQSGTAIRNYIPNLCTLPTCNPYLITRSDGENTSGYILTGGGSVDLSQEDGDQTGVVDEDGRNRIGTVDPKVAQERYEYFVRLYDFPENPDDDFETTAAAAQKPVSSPVNAGVEAYYRNGDLTIEDEWDIGTGEEYVVFVNGDLNVNAETHVAIGGFLAFIVTGDVIVSPDVEHTVLTETTPLVEGVFIANGQIQLPSRGAANGGDGRFVGEGSFVGWSGIVLERDFDDNGGRKVENNDKPVEIFRYRPDFVLNAPEEMRVPRYIWREVAP